MKSHVSVELEETRGDQVPDRVMDMLAEMVAIARGPGSDIETAMNAVMFLTVYIANTSKMTDSNFEAWLQTMRENRKNMPRLRDDALAETLCGFESEPS